MPSPSLISGRFQVLLVESNPADAYLTIDALKQAGLNDVKSANDSSKALEILQDGSPPDLVLLDLNIAPLSGLELLSQIRSDGRLGAVPVIIVSGSENKDDVRRAYKLGANCYITKPGRLEEFLRCMKACYEFWGTVATLPPK